MQRLNVKKESKKDRDREPEAERETGKGTKRDKYIYISNFEVKWSIIEKGRKFDPITRKCMLCLKEKYHIIFNQDGSSLNRRSELFSLQTQIRKFTGEYLNGLSF